LKLAWRCSFPGPKKTWAGLRPGKWWERGGGLGLDNGLELGLGPGLGLVQRPGT